MNWEQLKTILWLRWRLTRNQWARSGGLGAVIAVLAGLGAVVMGGLCFVGALLGAAFGLGEVSPKIIMAIWFGVTVGFLFFWMIGLLTELQRSETIDLQRLMHLPVALGQMFVVNYLVSHFALSIIVAVPIMLGLGHRTRVRARAGNGVAGSAGLEHGLHDHGVDVLSARLAGNADEQSAPPPHGHHGHHLHLHFAQPGTEPLFQRPPSGGLSSRPAVHHRTRKCAATAGQEKLNQLLAAQKFIPPLWLPLGAQGLAEGRVLPALLGTLGCLGIGALGLRRAYRSTVSFYYGETGGKAPARIKPAGHRHRGGRPGQEPAAVFWNCAFPPCRNRPLRWRWRHSVPCSALPEVKMAFGSSFLVMVIFGVMFFFVLRPISRTPRSHSWPPVQSCSPCSCSSTFSSTSLALTGTDSAP